MVIRKSKRKIIITAAILVAVIITLGGAWILFAPTPTERSRAEAKASAKALIKQYGVTATSEQKDAAYEILAKHMPPANTNGTTSLDDMFERAFAYRRLQRIAKGEYETDDEKNEFTPEEREILELANEAISDEDLETAVDIANVALESENPQVRLKAVETLSSFGEAGIPELSEFLTDTDEEVASLAADRYELAAQEIENDTERVAVAKLGVFSLNDEGELEAMMGTLMMSSDTAAVIEALADIIDNGSELQANVAKSAYQSQTGEDWQNAEAAEAWIKANNIEVEVDSNTGEMSIKRSDG